MALFRPDPAGIQTALARAGQAIQQKAAPAMAEAMREALARGERSGNFYPSGLRASAPGEYPQEVSGELRRSVGSAPLSPTSAAVGFINAPPPYATDLEFKPAARGGRQPVTKAMLDPEIQKAGKDAL
jgi:hypothetical protein